MLRQEVVVRLGGTRRAPPVHAARADCGDRLIDVPGGAAWILRRIREAYDALSLVVLQDVDPERGPGPEDERRAGEADREQQRDLRPASPGDEQRRAEDPRVDDRRAEVRLQEDEQHRHRGEADRRKGRLPLVDPLAPVGEERGQEEHEQELPELGRLEAEGPDVDPAPRVADARAEQGRQDEHRDQEAVDDPRVLAPEAGIDQRHPGQARAADQRVCGLADDVVVRVAGDVVLRDPRDHPEAVRDDPAGRGQQHPVEVAQVRALARACSLPGRESSVGRVVGHQSVGAEVALVAFLPKNCSNTWSADGAATAPP